MRTASRPLSSVVTAWGIALMLCGVSASASMDSSPKDDVKVRSKSVTGDLVYIGKRAISVEFSATAKSSEEMLLPVTAHTKVHGPKPLAELKRGDRVSVRYEQTYKAVAGEPDQILTTVATEITLLRSALPEGALRSAAPTPGPPQ